MPLVGKSGARDGDVEGTAKLHLLCKRVWTSAVGSSDSVLKAVHGVAPVLEEWRKKVCFGIRVALAVSLRAPRCNNEARQPRLDLQESPLGEPVARCSGCREWRSRSGGSGPRAASPRVSAARRIAPPWSAVVTSSPRCACRQPESPNACQPPSGSDAGRDAAGAHARDASADQGAPLRPKPSGCLHSAPQARQIIDTIEWFESFLTAVE